MDYDSRLRPSTIQQPIPPQRGQQPSQGNLASTSNQTFTPALNQPIKCLVLTLDTEKVNEVWNIKGDFFFVIDATGTANIILNSFQNSSDPLPMSKGLKISGYSFTSITVNSSAQAGKSITIAYTTRGI